MIVKIVEHKGEGGARFYECNRAIPDGYNGGSGEVTTRNLRLESDNQDPVNAVFTERDRVYVLNNEGKTIDRIWF